MVPKRGRDGRVLELVMAWGGCAGVKDTLIRACWCDDGVMRACWCDAGVLV